MDSSHALAAHAASPAHIDTSTGLDSRKMAFWTFIGSECLLFGSLIATYMAYKGRSLKPPYPHDIVVNGKAYEGALNIPLTTFSTFILLMSSVAMVFALYNVQRGVRKWSAFWLFMTALGGSIFLGCQVYEFTEFYHRHPDPMTLQANLFGSTFFVLTGFHGAHVTVGVIYLITLGVMSLKGRIGPERTLNVEIAGLYWHFVDVIWIVIFPLVYLIK
jgi:cytochrome c oxidase subunit 3/cytochrome o ubiquinol oxidase subunit 3